MDLTSLVKAYLELGVGESVNALEDQILDKLTSAGLMTAGQRKLSFVLPKGREVHVQVWNTPQVLHRVYSISLRTGLVTVLREGGDK